MSNFSHLYAYLDDLSGPEYEYLGHFDQMQYLEDGHNTLGIEDQIDAGNIPDLHAEGKNTPADSEPGNISQMGDAGASAGSGQAVAAGQSKSSGVIGGAAKSVASDAIKGGLKSLFDLA